MTRKRSGQNRPRLPSRIAILALALGLPLQACSVGMALSGDERPDLSALRIGASRTQVEAQLGQPSETSRNADGQEVVTYRYTIGGQPSRKRAIVHGTMDVLTLGLWEIVGTPLEIGKGDTYRALITYDDAGKVISIRKTGDLATKRKAEKAIPKEVPSNLTSTPVAFTRAVLKVPRNRPLGTVSVGSSCSAQEDLTFASRKLRLDPETYADIFRDELINRNFNVVGNEGELFNVRNQSSARYLVGGLIQDVEANICIQDANANSGAVFMEVEWQIFDAFDRAVIARIRTAGDGIGERGPNGARIAFQEAFADATRNLLADERFYDLVTSGPGKLDSADDRARVRGVAIASRALRFDESRRLDAAALRDAVAVIRTAPAGFGSGFLITENILLTNQHVVGGAEKVRVIFGDGLQADGTVLARDSRRDVALVDIGLRGKTPLSIRTTGVAVGEDVYSYGSPVAETFQGTLRKGIASANRRSEDGLAYIQSDVGVNPGNSGGPLLDARGNVIGVAVKGIFTGAAPIGINFFIPIRDAFEALSIAFPEAAPAS